MRLRLLLASAAAAGLFACAGCTGTKAARAGDGAGEPVVRRGTFVATFLLTGELEAKTGEDFTVPRLPSWETTIRWMEADGARVKSGQKVVEFDDTSFGRDLEEKRLQRAQAASDLEEQRSQVEATLADKEFQVAQRRIALDKARSEAEVPRELLALRQWQERQLALERAQSDLDKAVEEYEAAKTANAERVEQREITVAKADREISAAEAAIARMTLVAPRDGIMVWADHPWEGRKLQIGDNAWVGMTVARLPDLRAMRVKAHLSDVDDGRIVPGLHAVATLDTYPDIPFRGRVTEIAPVAQEVERMSLRRGFEATIELEETDPERMRPGMSVRVEVEADRRDGVLLAPRAALDLAPSAPRALLARGGEADVRLGPCNAQECVVEDGLAEGEALRLRP